MRKVIAIDGPSGAGKSTVAKLIAAKLNYDYLDTGALYRAVALHLKRLGLDANSTDQAIASVLGKTEVAFRNGRVYLNNEDVSDEIRSTDAGHYASVFSTRKPVRDYLLSVQRDTAEQTNLVAEGRDMTTIVFPDAYKKIYLDATVDERMRRRTLELTGRGQEVDDHKIKKEIIERDMRDSGRDIAPLKKADDAHLVESTGLSIQEVLSAIMNIINDISVQGKTL
ncbi:MAG: (d)CMP kinase [Nitrospiraceae bacterium]|nr:MAG: (d)CMP kinase [Nitrospiraceae bacterium]